MRRALLEQDADPPQSYQVPTLPLVLPVPAPIWIMAMNTYTWLLCVVRNLSSTRRVRRRRARMRTMTRRTRRRRTGPGGGRKRGGKLQIRPLFQIRILIVPVYVVIDVRIRTRNMYRISFHSIISICKNLQRLAAK